MHKTKLQTKLRLNQFISSSANVVTFLDLHFYCLANFDWSENVDQQDFNKELSLDFFFSYIGCLGQLDGKLIIQTHVQSHRMFCFKCVALFGVNREFSYYLFSHKYVAKPASTPRLLEGKMRRQGLGRGKPAFRVCPLEAITAVGL